jgi:hypothetical protein
MSNVAERYHRCPACDYPNLAAITRCQKCGDALSAAEQTETLSDQPKIINEGLLFAAAIGVGVLVGIFAIGVAGLVSHGEFFSAVAKYLSPSMNRGRSSGLLTLFLVPLFWWAIARRLALPGKDEVFDGKQVNVGTFATFFLTAVLCALSLGIAPNSAQESAGQAFESVGDVWMPIALVCQCLTLATTVITWSRLDYLYGASSDYEF